MARLCKPSWLDNYLRYTQNQESPTAFHKWVGLSILSSAVGRGVIIPRIKYTLRPNLYVILVAESAKCRKSSSLNIGKSIIEGMKKPPFLFAQKITPEALISALTKANIGTSTYGLLFSTELGVFLSKDALSRGVTSILNDLYDSPDGDWVYHTKGGGKQVLVSPTLGMIAATTKSEVGDIIPDAAVGGGFTSRIIFVYQDKPSKIHLFNPETEDGVEVAETQGDLDMRVNLIADLNTVKDEVMGYVKFTKGAKDVAMDWYSGEMRQVRDEKLDGYYGRKHDIMFKVATLLSISEASDLVIRDTHITQALENLEENEKNLGSIIDSVVSTKVGSIIEKVHAVIKRRGTITHSDLLQKCWRLANSQEMAIIIKTLLESKEIEEVIDGRNRYYKITSPKRT